MAAYHLGEDKFVKVVRLVERVVFRYITVVGAHATALYMVYYSQVEAMRADPAGYQVETLRVQLARLVQANATDETLGSLLVGRLHYSVQGGTVNRIIRHFLSTLDSYWPWLHNPPRGAFPRPETTPFFDVFSSTVEHIHSQRPQQPDQAMDERVHRLGNLLVVGQDENGRYGNNEFAAKRAQMATSNHPHVREVGATYGQWTPTELEAREEELVRLAKLLFRI
jgi:hypothetical protein